MTTNWRHMNSYLIFKAAFLMFGLPKSLQAASVKTFVLAPILFAYIKWTKSVLHVWFQCFWSLQMLVWRFGGELGETRLLTMPRAPGRDAVNKQNNSANYIKKAPLFLSQLLPQISFISEPIDKTQSGLQHTSVQSDKVPFRSIHMASLTLWPNAVFKSTPPPCKVPLSAVSISIRLNGDGAVWMVRHQTQLVA